MMIRAGKNVGADDRKAACDASVLSRFRPMLLGMSAGDAAALMSQARSVSELLPMDDDEFERRLRKWSSVMRVSPPSRDAPRGSRARVVETVVTRTCPADASVPCTVVERSVSAAPNDLFARPNAHGASAPPIVTVVEHRAAFQPDSPSPPPRPTFEVEELSDDEPSSPPPLPARSHVAFASPEPEPEEEPEPEHVPEPRYEHLPDPEPEPERERERERDATATEQGAHDEHVAGKAAEIRAAFNASLARRNEHAGHLYAFHTPYFSVAHAHGLWDRAWDRAVAHMERPWHLAALHDQLKTVRGGSHDKHAERAYAQRSRKYGLRDVHELYSNKPFKVRRVAKGSRKSKSRSKRTKRRKVYDISLSSDSDSDSGSDSDGEEQGCPDDDDDDDCDDHALCSDSDDEQGDAGSDSDDEDSGDEQGDADDGWSYSSDDEKDDDQEQGWNGSSSGSDSDDEEQGYGDDDVTFETASQRGNDDDLPCIECTTGDPRTSCRFDFRGRNGDRDIAYEQGCGCSFAGRTDRARPQHGDDDVDEDFRGTVNVEQHVDTSRCLPDPLEQGCSCQLKKPEGATTQPRPEHMERFRKLLEDAA